MDSKRFLVVFISQGATASREVWGGNAAQAVSNLKREFPGVVLQILTVEEV